MTEDQFKCEKLYQTTLAIARVMLCQGLLTEEEIRVIDTIMLEKYKPLLGGLQAYNS